MRRDEKRRKEKRREEKNKDTLTNPYPPWFFFAGITILWSIAIYFFLVPDPVRVKSFSYRAKYILVARLRTNNSGVRNTKWKKDQVMELLTDLKFWLAFWMGCLAMVMSCPLKFLLSSPFPFFFSFLYIFQRWLVFLFLILLLQQRSATAPSPPSCPSSSPDSASVPSTHSSSRCPQEPTAAPSCS